ncbi:7-deoxyloganetin glucosyltransferase-like [Gastrolobium bilobum]|uniref:7-deoxyloganetin glucosyltransferase-like n=1 Tax=Gastrolobium bilobum TaxID=150636 RepID=UPI002AB097C0|nr:7-deoxyloganetin glucosyltransferase-like [Gastrolobium bilobum]
MSSLSIAEKKPHAICIPYPAQGHITPMLKLAKILHFRGFHITFVNTEFNHKRLLKSQGPNSLNGFHSFRFETIPDGLPESDVEATQDTPSLSASIRKTCLSPFKNLLHKLNNATDIPPVTCIVSDGVMSFTLIAAKELGIPEVLFWTMSACGFMCLLHFGELIKKGLTPLKDSSYLTNGYLETAIDWVPGIKEILLRDIPSFIRTTDPDDLMLEFVQEECGRALHASAIILNTFDALEHDVLDALSSILPPVYSIGPLNLLLNQVTDEELNTIGSNLWKEDRVCLEWLDTKETNSVVYVNFGSITVMTREQLIEFAWGLANSNQNFLWVIRPDLVVGENAVLPMEFVTETKKRGLLSNWCPQEEVLAHPAIGGFLTHSGWNSTIESLCNGVPVICWPFFAEQPTNCRFCCKEWGIGLQIGSDDVKRDRVESLVRELMEGQQGKVLTKKALEWKKLAEDAAIHKDGSSFLNFDNMVRQVLLSEKLKSS